MAGCFLLTGCNTHRATTILGATAVAIQSVDAFRSKPATYQRPVLYRENRSNRAATILGATAVAIQTVSTIGSTPTTNQQPVSYRKPVPYDQHRPNLLCQQKGHMDNSACVPPPDFPKTTSPPSGRIAKPTLRSCSNSDIGAQIRSITSQGKRLKRGAGIKRINQITVQVMDASIHVYRQAMRRCNVDKAAYRQAIRQLEGARRTARANVDRL